MSIETLLIIGFVCLLVLTIIQSLQIDSLNRRLERCFDDLASRPDKYDFRIIQSKIDRLDKPIQFQTSSKVPKNV